MKTQKLIEEYKSKVLGSQQAQNINSNDQYMKCGAKRNFLYTVLCSFKFKQMNKKKKEQKRKARGLLSMDEHFEKRKKRQEEIYQKNSKNNGKKKFGSN